MSEDFLKIKLKLIAQKFDGRDKLKDYSASLKLEHNICLKKFTICQRYHIIESFSKVIPSPYLISLYCKKLIFKIGFQSEKLFEPNKIHYKVL